MKVLLLTMLLSLPTFASTKVITLTPDNFINFGDVFTSEYVSKKQKELIDLDQRLEPGKEIYIFLDTPGGSISAGNLFINTATSLGRPIHTITLFAASMGYHTAQGLGKRYIMPSGELMSHRGHVSELSGQINGELNTRVNHFTTLMNEMDTLAAGRVGTKLETYQALILNELWLYGNNAVKTGHADEVVLVKCSKSLNTTRKEVVNTFFGSFAVEFSNCPLIRYPLVVEPQSSKKKMSKNEATQTFKKWLEIKKNKAVFRL